MKTIADYLVGKKVRVVGCSQIRDGTVCKIMQDTSQFYAITDSTYCPNPLHWQPLEEIIIKPEKHTCIFECECGKKRK